MKRLKKTAAAMMSGILAMSPAGAIFADETATDVTTYGGLVSIAITQGGEELTADLTTVYNESGDSSLSVSLTFPASMMGTEEPVVYGFDDVLRVCGGDVYLNVDEVLNLYQDFASADDSDSIRDLLSMVGITESWLQIPTTSSGSDSSDDTIANAIVESMDSLESVATDTGVQFTINNDAILLITQNIEDAIASSEGTEDASAEEDFEGIALIADYMMAAAEGFQAADPNLSEEDSLALVSELLTSVFASFEDQIGAETEESTDVSLTEMVSAVLEAVSFDGVLSLDSDEGVTAVLLDLQGTTADEMAFGVQMGIASMTEGEFVEFSAPESATSLRDVVTNIASLYYTSIASYEEASSQSAE